MTRAPLALALLGFAASQAGAGEFNKVLKIGDAAPEWKDLEGTDGAKHALADLKDRAAVVVVFTCNSCPIAVGYEDRLLAFAAKHAGGKTGVEIVAINVNTLEADALSEMKKRAEKKKFPFAYLYDPSQEIARKFGATTTPEFFVLNGERKVVYMGALDDKLDPAEATVNYLVGALKAAMGAKLEIVAETMPKGCKIRFARKREE